MLRLWGREPISELRSVTAICDHTVLPALTPARQPGTWLNMETRRFTCRQAVTVPTTSHICVGGFFFSFAGRSFNTNSTSKFSSVSGWYSGQLVGLNPWICSMLGQLLLEWTINCRQVNHLPLVASKEYCWGSSQQYSHCSVSSNRTKLLNWNANLDASTANGFWVENFWTVWNHWNSDFMVIQRGNTKVWRSSFQFSLFHEMFKASSVHLCCFVVVFYIIK